METYAIIGAGCPWCYSAKAAAGNIDEFIQALLDARADGATHVVGLSGDPQGPKYMRLYPAEVNR